MRRFRALAAGAVALLAAALLCPIALGDADPASDVLLGENVFYPYSPQVSARLQATLNAQVAAAHKRHLPIKVALIATPVDLGALPTFFGKPRQYADFLDQEISFGSKVPLLVVMPGGYGTANLPGASAAAVASLPRPAGTGANALAQAASEAVRRLAQASGHPIAGAAGGSAGTGSGVAVPLAVLGGVCVALAGLIIYGRRRRARSR